MERYAIAIIILVFLNYVYWDCWRKKLERYHVIIPTVIYWKELENVTKSKTTRIILTIAFTVVYLPYSILVYLHILFACAVAAIIVWINMRGGKR